MEKNSFSKEILKNLETTSLTLKVILFEKDITIGEILQLNLGSVLNFNQEIGDDVAMFANDKKFAVGEIVQKNNKYAFRIKKLI